MIIHKDDGLYVHFELTDSMGHRQLLTLTLDLWLLLTKETHNLEELKMALYEVAKRKRLDSHAAKAAGGTT